MKDNEARPQTTDLPTELGWWARHSPNEELTPLLEAAASEIERLRAQVARLEEDLAFAHRTGG